MFPFPIFGFNTRVNSSSGLWTGQTASWTFTGDDITNGTVDRHIRTASAISTTGDFDVVFTPTNLANSQGFGVYDTAEDATFSDVTGSPGAGMASMTNSWWVKITAATTYNAMLGASTAAVGLTIANSDVIKIARESGTTKIYKNGSVAHTYASTQTVTTKAVAYNVNGVTFPTFADVSWSG